MWGSKLQTLIMLSMTEVEYIALSMALHEVIGMMKLLTKIKSQGTSSNSESHVLCFQRQS